MEQLISDHKAVCFQLNLQKPLNERKSVVSRRLRNFDSEAFNKMIISSGLLADVSDLSLELMVVRYNVLRDTMDILAPVKSRTIVLRPNAPWYNEDIANEKRNRRRLGRRWRSSRLESDRLSYIEQCSVVNTMLYKAKEFYYSSVIRDNADDTMQRQTEKHYPSADNDQQLANDFADFFTVKIERIRGELTLRKSGLVHSPGLAKPACLSRLSELDLVTDDDVLKLIRGSTIKACKLDPLPATIMRSCYWALVPVFKTVINLSLSTGSMPEDLKIVSLRPLLKKPNADCEQFSNFRPVSNLKFLSKLVEKTVFVQLNNYLTVNGLHESFQSAYKAHRSTETALLTITDDITVIGQGEQCVPIVIGLVSSI